MQAGKTGELPHFGGPNSRSFDRMRIVLRHVRTGHYYSGNDEWRASRADAKDFETIDAALEAIASARLDGMSLIIEHDQSGREQEFFLGEGVPDAEMRERVKKIAA